MNISFLLEAFKELNLVDQIFVVLTSVCFFVLNIYIGMMGGFKKVFFELFKMPELTRVREIKDEVEIKGVTESLIETS